MVLVSGVYSLNTVVKYLKKREETQPLGDGYSGLGKCRVVKAGKGPEGLY